MVQVGVPEVENMRLWLQEWPVFRPMSDVMQPRLPLARLS